MTTAFLHVGLNVSDVERSLDFYGRLGFVRTSGPRVVEGAFIEGVMGLPGTRMRTAFAVLDGMTLELVEFLEPRGLTRLELAPNDVGGAHVAVKVDDCRMLYEQLRADGIDFLAPPSVQETGPNAGSVVVFGYDPDGAVFQLVQRPDLRE